MSLKICIVFILRVTSATVNLLSIKDVNTQFESRIKTHLIFKCVPTYSCKYIFNSSTQHNKKKDQKEREERECKVVVQAILSGWL